MASQEGFNLWNKIQRENVLRYAKQGRKDKWFLRGIWVQTISYTLCLLFGHEPYITEDREKACKRCHQYIS